MTSFGERLKQLMEDQSISQRDLAAALNISKSTVSGYVNSYREPDFKSLLEIASIFHVTTDYLLGNSDIPSLPTSAHNYFLFYCFFQRIVSCIILPPVFVTGFLLHLIFLRFHPVLCRHLLKYFRLHQPCDILCVPIL